jgi:hypothetical protein
MDKDLLLLKLISVVKDDHGHPWSELRRAVCLHGLKRLECKLDLSVLDGLEQLGRGFFRPSTEFILRVAEGLRPCFAPCARYERLERLERWSNWRPPNAG